MMYRSSFRRFWRRSPVLLGAPLAGLALAACGVSGSGTGDLSPNASAGLDASIGGDATAGGIDVSPPGTSGTDGTGGADASAPTTDGGTATPPGPPGCACPTGFTCVPGTTTCKSPSGIPHFGQVYVILMENQQQTAIEGSKSAPYINELLTKYARTTNYTAITNPSLPNYIALTSGDTQGIGCDCYPSGRGSACTSTCNQLFNDCNCNRDVRHLGDQLDDAGLSWRVYGESMGTPCNTANVDSAHYAVRHVPFLYYDDFRTAPARCAEHAVDATNLDADRGRYAFSFIAPNLCNDMHDACGPGGSGDRIRQGDDWLKANVRKLTDADGFDRDGVVFIVWDEGTFLDNTVSFIAISPLAKTKFSTDKPYNHYALLATIEDGLGLPRLGNAKSAPVMAEIFE